MTTIKKITNITDDQITQLGYEVFFNFGGHFIAVMPMLQGKGRIIYSESLLGVENAWCYKTYAQALFEFYKWNSETQQEPSGWIRNPITGQRRKDGDPSQEYFYP